MGGDIEDDYGYDDELFYMDDTFARAWDSISKASTEEEKILQTCPGCLGNKEVVLLTSIERPCKTCSGSGKIVVSKKMIN